MAALDVDSTGAEITAGLLTRGMAVVADVADSAQVDEAVRSVVETYGRLDILVNNAGIRGGQEADDAVDADALRRDVPGHRPGEALDRPGGDGQHQR
ncbi:SDR family NAD(P)-dependent oxidoreductase [Saccharothrix algeriensis]|uniref:SDR family NAD(P)-dependent oxidoreductase n=1 Tax=Saccharothrix algeriensis TaxID=173560 RepID=A0A8T8HWT7_9PSEU|nr:SDR family NAD(P)-dependent oxidoreductase [Saccharothrix algeriensis]